jgi:hypothetical protein
MDHFVHAFGAVFALTYYDCIAQWGAHMAILVFKIIASWSAIAIVTGFALGAAIRHSDRIRKDVFLTCVFDYLETMQTSGS